MSEFLPVAKVSQFPATGRLVVEIDDQFVVLVRVDGQFYCIDDVCTHDGGPLGEGKLIGFHIACPRHGAQFDVRSGKAMTMPATEDTQAHEVRVEGDNILVRLCGEQD